MEPLPPFVILLLTIIVFATIISTWWAYRTVKPRHTFADMPTLLFIGYDSVGNDLPLGSQICHEEMSIHEAADKCNSEDEDRPLPYAGFVSDVTTRKTWFKSRLVVTNQNPGYILYSTYAVQKEGWIVFAQVMSDASWTSSVQDVFVEGGTSHMIHNISLADTKSKVAASQGLYVGFNYRVEDMTAQLLQSF